MDLLPLLPRYDYYRILKAFALLFTLIGLLFIFFGKTLLKVVAALSGLAVGAAIGFVLGKKLFPSNDGYLILTVIVLALIGALVGLWILRSTIAWMGFLSFAGIVYMFLGRPSINSLLTRNELTPVFYIIIGGIIGYILFYIFYDRILIILTVVIGAILVTLSLYELQVNLFVSIFIAAILAIFGYKFQSDKDEKKKPVISKEA